MKIKAFIFFLLILPPFILVVVSDRQVFSEWQLWVGFLLFYGGAYTVFSLWNDKNRDTGPKED